MKTRIQENQGEAHEKRKMIHKKTKTRKASSVPALKAGRLFASNHH
jgi:hypothetical protein